MSKATKKKYVIRCDMCSSDEDCPYDHIPQYPCKDFWTLVEAEG